jgi:hypothetical protein
MEFFALERHGAGTKPRLQQSRHLVEREGLSPGIANPRNRKGRLLVLWARNP